jgi:branched-chain amino acid transport system permease protein
VIWPLAMLVAALAGLVIGLLSLRTRGVYFIMITLAFAQMLYFFFVALKSWGGDDGLAMSTRNLVAGIKIVDAQTFYWLCFGLLSLVWLALGRMLNARFGLVLRGAKASARRMAAIGFDVRHYQCLAFVLAAAVAGLGGALWANLGRFVAPDMLSWTRSGDFLVMVILGGSGTVLGPVVGAALYLLLETQLAGMSQYWQMVFGPLVVAVALFLPRGLCAIDGGGRDG